MSTLAAVIVGVLTAVAKPAAATPPTATISGAASGADQKDWFNTGFGSDAGSSGRVRGRLQFVTDTTATLSATRTGVDG